MDGWMMTGWIGSDSLAPVWMDGWMNGWMMTGWIGSDSLAVLHQPHNKSFACVTEKHFFLFRKCQNVRD
jgi:hypothetical protein